MKVRPRSRLHFLLANPGTSPAMVLAQPLSSLCVCGTCHQPLQW